MKKSYKLFVLPVTAFILIILFSFSFAPIAVSAQSRLTTINLNEAVLIVNKHIDLGSYRIVVHYLQDSSLIIDIFDQDGGEGKLVFGGEYTLHSGETLDGDLVVMGGKAMLERDSTVKGSAVVFGGTIRADGVIGGELVTFGGGIELGEEAVVGGDVISFGGDLKYDEKTQFKGDVFTDIPIPFEFSFSEDFDFSEINFPQFARSFNPVRETLWFFFRSFMWTAVAVLFLLFFPKPITRISDALVSQPIISGGLGLLTAVVAPILLVLLMITLICIPISLILILVLGVAWVFGIVGLGFETGKRISKMLNQSWAPAVSAGFGTFILTFVINGIGLLVPCVGWIVPALVGLVGFGAVLLTRFGSQAYPPAYPSAGSVVVTTDENQFTGEIVESERSHGSESIGNTQSPSEEVE